MILCATFGTCARHACTGPLLLYWAHVARYTEAPLLLYWAYIARLLDRRSDKFERIAMQRRRPRRRQPSLRHVSLPLSPLAHRSPPGVHHSREVS